MIQSKNQTFNDGLCSVYTVGNIAEDGDLPRDGLTLKAGPLRYGERTVGVTRFWTAAQAQARIDVVVRVLRQDGISTQDVCVLRDGQYQVLQVQHPRDATPPVTDLSLRRLEAKYDIAPIS